MNRFYAWCVQRLNKLFSEPRPFTSMDVVWRHPDSGIFGTVEDISIDPAGKSLFRIQDHWFMSDDLVRV